jgi:hypothetical protein
MGALWTSIIRICDTVLGITLLLLIEERALESDFDPTWAATPFCINMFSGFTPHPADTL